MTANLAPFLPIAVGSLPHKDPRAALDLIFTYLPSTPFWPQLPGRDFRESMYFQYTGGIPSVRIDKENERISIDTSSSPERDLEDFYGHALSEDLEHFAFSDGCATGFELFLKEIERRSGEKMHFLKGQVTGPFSFGLSVPDEQGRAILYNEDYYEAVVTGLSLHARWQARALKRLHDTVILFIDEPYLVSYGSAFVSTPREEVVRSIKTVVEQIHAEGALVGVHCCGNTDWSLILDTGLDILNFDAFQFFENVMLFADQLKTFLARGGGVTFGIVPSDERVLSTGETVLAPMLKEHLNVLSRNGVDASLLRSRSTVSPACGLGSQTQEVAEVTLRTLRNVSKAMSDV